MEPEPPVAAESQQSADVGVRVPFADQYESVPVAGKEQGAQHTYTGSDAGPGTDPGQEFYEESVQRDAEQRRAQHVRDV